MRTDHLPVRSAYPNPSVPEDLVELYREHAAQLPPLSTACADGMRAALRAIGVEPPLPPPPTKTTAATAARTKQRPQGGPKGQWLQLTNETEQRCHCGNRARAAFVQRASRGVQATRLVCLAHTTQTARAAVAIANQNIEVIGRHRVLCGDITTGVVAQLLGEELTDVIYSDPPWGPGNQQYWHTMRSRGSVPRTSWPGFLAAFCGVCAAHRKPDAPVFVEMGMRWADELDAAMLAVGLPRQRRWVVTYGPKKKPLPVTLTLYGPRDIEIAMPEPAHGEPVTQAVLEAVVRPGALVLDPCTGLGMTARSTHRLGGHFRGTEMNATRLERTASWLRKAVR